MGDDRHGKPDYRDTMRLRFLELFLLFAVLPMILLAMRASGIRVSPLPVLWRVHCAMTSERTESGVLTNSN